MTSVLILTFVLMQLDMPALSQNINDLSLSSWLIAIPLVLGQLILIALRWRLLVNMGHSNVITRPEAIRICILGAMANLLFINTIGGILVRVGLAMQHGLELTHAIMSGLIDRALTLLALIILSACLFGYLSGLMPHQIYAMSGYLLIGLIGTGLLLIPLLFQDIYTKTPLSSQSLQPVLKFTKQLMTNHRLVVRLVAYSVLAQLLFIASCYFVVQTSANEVPIMALLALIPIMTLVSSIPLGYGGWGVREGAFIFGLGFLGVNMETAFLISLQIGVIGIVTTFIAALPFLILQKGDMFAFSAIKHEKPIA